MDNVGLILLLYVIGLLLIVAELFIPSHGLITLAALACLGAALYKTYTLNAFTGLIGLSACLVLVPTIMIVGLKYVRYLPMGHKIAPPNPVLTDRDRAFDAGTAERLIGRKGRAVTLLRPAGVCEFEGRRIQCVAQSGMIEPGAEVVGVAMQLNSLVVRPTAVHGPTA